MFCVPSSIESQLEARLNEHKECKVLMILETEEGKGTAIAFLALMQQGLGGEGNLEGQRRAEAHLARWRRRFLVATCNIRVWP